MEYLKDKKYIVEYITNKGEEKEIEFIPNKDMNIANVILEVKNNNKDFLKLKNIKDKKEENLMVNEEILKGKDILYILEEYNSLNKIDEDLHKFLSFCNDELNLNKDTSKIKDWFKDKEALEIALAVQKLSSEKVLSLIEDCYGKDFSTKFNEYLDSVIDSSDIDLSKIKYINLNESAEDNTNISNLYELLEARKFEGIDITDNTYDMTVYFEFDADDVDKDSYDTYLAILAKSLKIIGSVNNAVSLNEVTVDLTKYVENNFELLESIFDFSAESKDESIEILVTEIMPSVISGYTTESIYNQLAKESRFTMTENKKVVEFEELEDVDTKELKGTGEDQTETQEAIEQAVSEVENPTREEQFAVQGANDSINVLIADEETAIDGYKGFLKQCKDTIIPSLYEVLEKEINEIIADEEDHINKLNTIKASFHLEDIPLDESKKLKESIKHVEDLEVGDEVTIPYARGPKYTQDRSQWVKGKVIDINPDYVDLEVPTTLTVTTRQLSDWMSKNESKKLNEHIITSSGQEFGDKYNELTDKMSEVNREFGSSYGTIGKDFPNKYKDKLDEIDALLDIIASENKGKSDLDDVRVLFDLATIEQQEDLRKLTNENKVMKFDTESDKEDEYKYKYNLVLDIAEVYPDSPQEEEDGDMIMDYIKNHPEKSADEIAQLYLDYLEDGDTTILESKSLKESDNYNDLETKMEEEVYNYLLSNDFDPFDLDPDDSDAENQLNEIIEDFQSDIILDYMEKHDVELTWECNLDHFKPYGIKIHVWEV